MDAVKESGEKYRMSEEYKTLKEWCEEYKGRLEELKLTTRRTGTQGPLFLFRRRSGKVQSLARYQSLSQTRMESRGV
jgi:hypothetical protein